MKWTATGQFRSTGLLIMRVGLGIMFMLHGYPKLVGGPEKWTAIGGSMENLGVTFAPVFWGFMAGFAEFFGGIALALGLLFTPACLLLVFTMLVATIKHLAAGDGVMGSSHSIEVGIVFLGLIFTGPGAFSLDPWLYRLVGRRKG